MAKQRRNDDEDDLKSKPTAQIIRRRWEEGSKDLVDARRNWWVNACFMDGDQWIRWDRYNAAVVQQAQDISRTRIVVNRMAPAMGSLMGRLTAKPLRFEIRPTAADDATVAGAKLGENVLNTTHDEQDWERERAKEILDAYLGGCSIVYFDWDPNAGETVEVDEGGDRIVGTGEIELCALPVTDFVLQPGVRDPYKSAHWTSGVAMPCIDAQRRYKLKDKPGADAMIGKSALMQRLVNESGTGFTNDCCLVLTSWQPPGDNRKGWVTTVIGEEVVDGPHPWPFPFETPNFALFVQTEKTSRWPGRTVLSDVVDIQVAYNCVMSANVEAAKLAGNARIAIDDLSIDLMTELTDEPGEIIRYSSAGNKPEWMVAPGPTRGLLTIADVLDAKINDALAVHDISRGDVNVNRTPASTIAQLAEKDDTPLGRFAHDQSAGWSRLGRLILQTYEEKVSESRTVATLSQGRQAVATTKWTGARLRGQTNVNVPLEVTKPFSRVAARQSAIELWDRKIIQDPLKMAELMGEDPDDWLETLDPDVAKAKRENVKMAAGEVMIPAAFDDHAKHMAELNAFRKSAAYEESDPSIKWIIDMHAKAHETSLHEEAGIQMAKAQALPGSEQLPQADAPVGSRMPPTFNQQQALVQSQGSPAGLPTPPRGA